MSAPFGGAAPRAVAGYARVSTDRQAEEGVSLDVQERTIRQYCALRQWPEPVLYQDAGLSAYADAGAKRPAFRQVLRDAEARAIDAVVVVQIDRWSRDLRATLESLTTLGAAGCAFVSIAESLDFSTPLGKMALAMLAAIAQYQSDHKQAEARRVQAALWADGRWQWRPPFGARIGVDGRLALDEDAAPALARCLALAAEHGPHRAAELLTAEGVPPPGSRSPADRWGETGGRELVWWARTVGDIVDKGLWLVDQRAPFPALWLAARGRPRQAPARRDRAVWMATGLMRCAGCGGPVGQFPQVRDPRRRRRLRCLWRGKAGRAGCWQALTWSERYEDAMATAVEGLPDARFGRLVPAAPDMAALAALAEEERKLGVVYRRSSTMRDEDYARELAALKAREAALLPSGGAERALLHRLPELRRAFRGLPPADQNAALRLLVERVIVGADGAVTMVWRPFVREACGPDLCAS